MMALLFVFWQVVWVARKHAAALGKDVSRTFLICGCWTMFLWFMYPIAWGLCEGGNVIAPDSEAVFYGILDIMAKPVFGALLLWGHRNIDPARLGLHVRDYDDVPGVHAAGLHEKHNNGLTTGGHHNGVADTTTGPAVAVV